jgi:hypothetical protein
MSGRLVPATSGRFLPSESGKKNPDNIDKEKPETKQSIEHGIAQVDAQTR